MSYIPPQFSNQVVSPKSLLYGWNYSAAENSTAIQTCIDANKGKTIILPAGCQFAGVLLSGSSYNGTTIYCEGEVLLTPSAGQTNFQGAWMGLILQSCSNVTLFYRGNGQRSLQPDMEFEHLVGSFGTDNLTIPYFICREIRGDGLLVSDADQLNPSTHTTNLSIGFISGYNSADDGRQLLSIVSCVGAEIGTVVSRNIGGVVNAQREPGGVDLETDRTDQRISGIHFGSVEISGGQFNSGFGIFGMEVTGGQRDWNISNITVDCARITSTGGRNTGILRRFRDSTINIIGYGTSGTSSAGVDVDYCDNVDGSIASYFGGTAIGLGVNDFCNGLNVDIDVAHYTNVGVAATGLNNSYISGDVKKPGTSAAVGVNFNSGGGRMGLAQSGVTYAVNVYQDATNPVIGYNNDVTDTITFTSCTLQDANLSTFSTYVSAITNPSLFSGMRFMNLNVPQTSASATAGAATLHAQQGVITSESLTTAAGSSYTLTLTNVQVKTTSTVIASVSLGGATTGTPQITKITPGSGSATIVVLNSAAAAAFNGTILISFTIA